MESGETRNLSDYLGVLRRRRWLIVSVTVIAAAIALALSLVRTPVYEASASLEFEDPGQQSTEVTGLGVVDFFPQSAAAAGAETMTRTDVLEETSSALGGNPTPEELRSDVEASVNTTNNLVTVTVKADTAERAARITNELAATAQELVRNEARAFFRERARGLGASPADEATRQRLQTLAAVSEPAAIVAPAEAPSSAASPKPVRDTVIAAFLGLMLGIGAAFVRESLDRRATDAHEVQRRLGVPLVGYVRKESLGMVGMSANGSGQLSESDLEGFRILRRNVDFLGRDEELQVIAVTSALPEEGKSTVAASYAYASALVGRRTILVECDFRRPVLADRLGFDEEPGLSEFLAGEAKPQEVLRSVDVQGREAQPLPVILAGTTVFQPTESLASSQYRDFLEQLRKVYDLVVLDCAPLLPVGDTLEVLPHADGVLLCVRLRQTTLEQASAAKDAIEHLPARPMGLVITGLSRGSDDDYYGYASSKEQVPSREGATS